MRFDLFLETEFGITALLAMAATPNHQRQQLKHSSSAHEPDLAEAAAELDRKESAILRLMLQHCKDLDAEDQAQSRLRTAAAIPASSELPSQKPAPQEQKLPTQQQQGSGKGGQGEGRSGFHRRRLLGAITHRLLGKSGVLHLAANSRKPLFCRQLLAAGCFVDCRNLEGATPLHIASIAGDEETARVLIKAGADVDASTIRGETPFLLASHFLHAEVCELLLEHSVETAAKTKTEALNVFHALAAGVSRQSESQFRALAWEGELATAALAGMDSASLEKGIYSRGPAYLQEELLLVDQRVPSVVAAGSDLFLFPEQMLRRLWNARQVLLLLLHNAKPIAQLLSQQSNSGFAPGDLLVHSWSAFCKRREALLRQSELRLAALTNAQREESEEGWRQILHGVYILHEMLRPPEEQIPIAELPLHARTPRREELEAEFQKQLKRDAPWLFPDLQGHPSTLAQKTLRSHSGETLQNKTQTPDKSEAAAPPASAP